MTDHDRNVLRKAALYQLAHAEDNLARAKLQEKTNSSFKEIVASYRRQVNDLRRAIKSLQEAA